MLDYMRCSRQCQLTEENGHDLWRIMEFAMKESPQNPIETTFIVANNIRNGKAGVANIAEYAGSDICVIDIGCKKSPIYPDNPRPYFKWNTKYAKGTCHDSSGGPGDFGWV